MYLYMVLILSALVTQVVRSAQNVPLFDVVVKCGEHPGDPINITYSGAAHSVYAKSGQGCSLVEIEPTIFQLLNLRAGKDTKCGLQKSGEAELYKMDLIIQQYSVRQVNDPVYSISCNYEMQVSYGQTGKGPISESGIAKTPRVQGMGGNGTRAAATLELQDFYHQPVTDIYLGQMVRLVAIFSPGTGEAGIRIWNCKAEAGQQVFWLLVSGCGDGQMIQGNEGFNTFDGIVATSPSFRAFALPGYNTIVFICDYILCRDDSCQGSSCSHTRRKRKSGRWRRRNIRSRDQYSNRVSDDYEAAQKSVLPVIQTPVIRITDQFDLGTNNTRDPYIDDPDRPDVTRGKGIHTGPSIRRDLDVVLAQQNLMAGYLAGFAILCILVLGAIGLSVHSYRSQVQTGKKLTEFMRMRSKDEQTTSATSMPPPPPRPPRRPRSKDQTDLKGSPLSDEEQPSTSKIDENSNDIVEKQLHFSFDDKDLRLKSEIESIKSRKKMKYVFEGAVRNDNFV